MKKNKLFIIVILFICLFNISEVKADVNTDAQVSTVYGIMVSEKYLTNDDVLSRYSELPLNQKPVLYKDRPVPNNPIHKIFSESLKNVNLCEDTEALTYSMKVRMMYNGYLGFNENKECSNSESREVCSFTFNTDLRGADYAVLTKNKLKTELQGIINKFKRTINTKWKGYCKNFNSNCEGQLTEEVRAEIGTGCISTKDISITYNDDNASWSAKYVGTGNDEISSGTSVYSTDYDYPMGKWIISPFSLGPYYYKKDLNWRNETGTQCRSANGSPVVCSKMVGNIINEVGIAIDKWGNDNSYNDSITRALNEIFGKKIGNVHQDYRDKIETVITQSAIFEYLKNYTAQDCIESSKISNGFNDFVVDTGVKYSDGNLYHIRNMNWNFSRYYSEFLRGISHPDKVNKIMKEIIGPLIFNASYSYCTAGNPRELISLDEENDYNLYFDATSSYRSKKIKVNVVNVSSNEKIKIKFSSNIKDMKLCFNDGCKDMVGSNGEYSFEQEFVNIRNVIFYVSVSDNIASSNIGNINLTIAASFNDGSNCVEYNTYRYHAANSSGFVIFEKGAGNKVFAGDTEQIKFNLNEVDKKSCEEGQNLNNKFNNNNLILNGLAKDKVCANKSNEKDDYTAEYGKCNVIAVSLDDGSKVAVRLYENTKFAFGPVTTEEIIPGQGFGLQRGTGNVLSTQYESTISWDYANYFGNRPYYFNMNNPSSNDASGIKSSITDKLAESISNELVVKFKAGDPGNNKVGMDVVEVENKITCDKADTSIRCYLEDKMGMKLKHACMKIDNSATVIYKEEECNNDTEIDGGYQYYVPLDYFNNGDNTKFNFDIDFDTQFSLLSGKYSSFSAKLDAKCDLDNGDPHLDNFYGLVRYRSIDLNNPFPRAKNQTDIPVNWREWYEKAANKIRLKETYNKGEAGIFYRANINSNTSTSINDRGKGRKYTDWSNIEKPGSSKFIGNNLAGDYPLFTKANTRNSYCRYGVFSDFCDKYW